jgi:folate-dependent tRNA-U54 methylase TrmFO/GidA
MNSNWGLVEPLAKRVKDKKQKREMLAERAAQEFAGWMETQGIVGRSAGVAEASAG